MGTIAQVQEAISEAELQKRQRLAIRENEIISEIDTVRANRADAFDRLSIVRDALERARITAPKSGVVMNLRAFTIGGVLDRGARIMDIVPDDAPRLIEAALRPEDIDNVKAGMRAQVHLTAYRQRTIPIIHGTVVRVSADRIVTPERADPHYQLIVEVDPEELAKLPEITLTPGMPAEVMISNGSRTALDYLIGPLFQAMHRAGREQ
jgi:HlyD family type I secretion membrane fusion protein